MSLKKSSMRYVFGSKQKYSAAMTKRDVIFFDIPSRMRCWSRAVLMKLCSGVKEAAAPMHGRTGGRADEQTGGRAAGRPGGRPGGQTDGRTDGRTGGRAGGRTDFCLISLPNNNAELITVTGGFSNVI